MDAVSAAIIRTRPGYFLICRRRPDKNGKAFWEFPGGKQEPGESPEECLVRECIEELEIRIQIIKLIATFCDAAPNRKSYLFSFYLCRIISGEPTLSVHTDLREVTWEEMTDYAFCSADERIVRKIQKNPLLLL